MKSLRIVLLSVVLTFAGVSVAQAAYCPVAKRCSTKACSCPSGKYSGVWTHKFKKFSLNLKSECSRGARNAERKLERRHRGRNYRCSWKRLAYRVKNVLGHKKGWCKFRLTCRWSTRKSCRTVYKLGRTRTFTGGHTYKFKGWKNRSVCGRADAAAKRHIAKKYRCQVVYFKRTSFKYRKKNTLGYKKGYCSIRYVIKCRSKIPVRCCSCSGR